MAEQVLASKLKVVKENVYAALEKGEIIEDNYYKMIGNLLSGESFYDSASENDKMLLGIKVANAIKTKFDLKESWGLQKRYIARKDVPLSNATQRDLEEYDRMKESAKAYIQEAFGDKPFSQSELDAKIHEHLMNYDWPFDPKPRDISTAIGRLGVSVPLELKKEPKETKIIGGYDEETLNKILHEI